MKRLVALKFERLELLLVSESEQHRQDNATVINARQIPQLPDDRQQAIAAQSYRTIHELRPRELDLD